jgi:hypothetical protein
VDEKQQITVNGATHPGELLAAVLYDELAGLAAQLAAEKRRRVAVEAELLRLKSAPQPE